MSFALDDAADDDEDCAAKKFIDELLLLGTEEFVGFPVDEEAEAETVEFVWFDDSMSPSTRSTNGSALVLISLSLVATSLSIRNFVPLKWPAGCLNFPFRSLSHFF